MMEFEILGKVQLDAMLYRMCEFCFLSFFEETWSSQAAIPFWECRPRAEYNSSI
jgi:hypothetical protein